MKYYSKITFFIIALGFMGAAAVWCGSENEAMVKKSPKLTAGEVFQSEHSANPLSRPEADNSAGETPSSVQ